MSLSITQLQENEEMVTDVPMQISDSLYTTSSKTASPITTARAPHFEPWAGYIPDFQSV